MTKEEKIAQAERDGNFDTCPECKKLVPVILTKFDPDEDFEDNLIQCLICGTGIRFI